MKDSSFDYAKDLIKKYHSKDFNEADTRHKIIDGVIHNVLSRPKELVKCESFIFWICRLYINKKKW